VRNLGGEKFTCKGGRKVVIGLCLGRRGASTPFLPLARPLLPAPTHKQHRSTPTHPHVFTIVSPLVASGAECVMKNAGWDSASTKHRSPQSPHPTFYPPTISPTRLLPP
jgi:hypothetical protein